MKKLLGLLTVSFSVSLSAAAMADAAPEPCEGKEVGDVCETYDQKAGTCQQDNGFVDCVENSATTTSSTTTSGAGTGGGGEGGTDGSGGSGAGTEDDGGCSVAAVGAPVAAGSMSLLALALVAGLRLGGRRRKQG